MLLRSSEDHTVPISTQDQQEDNIDNKLLSWAMTNNLLEELEKQSNHFEVDAAKVNVTFSQLIFRTKIFPVFLEWKLAAKSFIRFFCGAAEEFDGVCTNRLEKARPVLYLFFVLHCANCLGKIMTKAFSCRKGLGMIGLICDALLDLLPNVITIILKRCRFCQRDKKLFVLLAECLDSLH